MIYDWFLKGLRRLTGGMSDRPKENQNEVATGMFLKGLGRLAADMSDKTVVIEKYEKCTWDFSSMPKNLIGKLGSKDKLLQDV